MNVRAGLEMKEWMSSLFRKKQDFPLSGGSCQNSTKCTCTGNDGFRDCLLGSNSCIASRGS